MCGPCACCEKIGDKWDKEEEADCKFRNYEDRGCCCNDNPCLLFFFAFFAGVVYILMLAQAEGSDPYRIINGMQYDGQICGRGNLVDFPVAIWPDPTEVQLKFCAQSCNESSTSDLMAIPYDSTEYVGYCVPDDLAKMAADIAASTLNGTFAISSSVNSAVADVYTAAWPIFGSIFLSLIVAVMYVNIVGKCGYCIIMSCAMLMVLCGLLFSYMLYTEAEAAKAAGNEEDGQYMEIGCYVAAGVSIIFLAVIFWIRKRIAMAVAILKAAGEALKDMPMTIFFPIVPMFMGCLYVLFWGFVSLNVLSISNPENLTFPDSLTFLPGATKDAWEARLNQGSDTSTWVYEDYVFDDAFQYHFGVVFFHLLWVVQFFIYFNFLVIAGAVADWYFIEIDEAKGEKSDMKSWMVGRSCKRTCRFSLGSVAFGSFIIAVVDMIRAIVKYIEEKAKSTGEPNQAQKALVCAIQCCLTCLRCCLDKLSKNAYCWIAAWGGDFLTGACNSFRVFLKPENVVRVAAMNFTSSILLFCGKGFTALVTTALMCAIIPQVVEVSSLLMPAVLIFVMSLFIAHIFMLEFDVAVDQIFLCFLVDEKTHNGAIKYGTPRLQEVFHSAAANYKKLHPKVEDTELDKKASST
jgi:hypothetical protein